MSRRQKKTLKLEQFCIIIDNEKKVYYPGETIAGIVLVCILEEMMVVGLSVEFCGRVKTCWSEGAGEEKKTHTGDEVLFKNTKSVFGHVPSSTAEKRTSIGTQHKVGQYKYPFTFAFPQILPTSFEGQFGTIRYFLKGKHIEYSILKSPQLRQFGRSSSVTINQIVMTQIHKPGVKLDYITKIPITIIDRIDTTEMYCFTRKEDEVLETIGCLGLKPGTVFCKADMERGCYIPGENIRFNARVENHSTKTLKGVKAKLDMIVDYFADDPVYHKICRKTLLKIKGPKIHVGETIEWANQNIQVPVTCPTIHNCSLINIQYVIIIYVDVRCFRNVSLSFELIIGTIPGHVKVDDVSHSYRSIPECLAVSFNDDQEEICKITHEVEYLPTYPYLEMKTISDTPNGSNENTT